MIVKSYFNLRKEEVLPKHVIEIKGKQISRDIYENVIF